MTIKKNSTDLNKTTQPVDEIVDETSENILNKTLPAKYLVLSNGILWKDPDSDFMLTWTDQTVEHTLQDPAYGDDVKQPKIKIKEGNWWVATSDIPEDPRLYTLINRAVRAGTLVFVNSPEKWLKDVRKNKANQTKRVGMVWSELNRNDVKNNKIVPRNPSIAYNTMSYEDKNSKAFKILQEAAQNLKELIPKAVGALSSKQSVEDFLKEALYVERNGYNRVAAPRGSVVDIIVNLMSEHGISSGIGIVTEEQEPITKDVKPLQIPL